MKYHQFIYLTFLAPAVALEGAIFNAQQRQKDYTGINEIPIPLNHQLRIWQNLFSKEDCEGPPNLMFSFTKQNFQSISIFKDLNAAVPVGTCGEGLSPLVRSERCCITFPRVSGHDLSSTSYEWETPFGDIPAAASVQRGGPRYCALWDISIKKSIPGTNNYQVTDEVDYPYEVIYVREGYCYQGVRCEKGGYVSFDPVFLECSERTSNSKSKVLSLVAKNHTTHYPDTKKNFMVEFTAQFGYLELDEANMEYEWYRNVPKVKPYLYSIYSHSANIRRRWVFCLCLLPRRNGS